MGNTEKSKGKGKKEAEGGITPSEALRNVLKIYFDDTPFGSQFGGRNGNEPMHYLQIYKADIEYANKHLSDDPQFQQDLLNASRSTLSMNESLK